jgi:hypothetical protein
MKKLKLEDIQVESYETCAVPVLGGTVQANEATELCEVTPCTCCRTCKSDVCCCC